jgi:Secretion system C-terminal sorting domain/Bacterial Ig-like domain (group 2)
VTKLSGFIFVQINIRKIMRSLFTFLSVLFISALASKSFATSISITASHDTICTGTPVTFTATVSGATAAHYHWYKNSMAVGADTSVFVGDSLMNGDVLQCLLDTGSSTSVVAISLPITISVFSVPHVGPITGMDTVCRMSSIILFDSIPGGTWISMNPFLANIDPTGTVTAGFGPGPGGVDSIMYVNSNYCGGDTAYFAVTVAGAPQIMAINGPHTLCLGAPSTMFVDSTMGGTWSSSNNVVATVDASGNVTPVAVGSATISYSLTNSCGTANRTRNIVVNAAPIPGPISGATSICQFDTTHLHVMQGGGTWASSDSMTGRIIGGGGGGGIGGGAIGVFFGINPGTVVVAYAFTTPCGSATDTLSITINPLPVVYPITGSDSVCPAGTTTLMDYATGGTWSASNTAVTSVSAMGVVTANATGMDTIMYSLTNSCGTVTQSMPIYVYCPSHAGVSNIVNSNDINIYPNPAADNIYIDGIVPGMVQIVDLMGATVAQQNGVSFISVQNLPSGIYMIAVYDEQHNLLARKKIEKI